MAVFSRYHAIQAVTLYGSRAKGNYRHNYDIDLVLTAPDMDWMTLNRREGDIDDLLLPWKMDLALWHQVENPDLLDHVSRVGIMVYGASNQ